MCLLWENGQVGSIYVVSLADPRTGEQQGSTPEGSAGRGPRHINVKTQMRDCHQLLSNVTMCCPTSFGYVKRIWLKINIDGEWYDHQLESNIADDKNEINSYEESQLFSSIFSGEIPLVILDHIMCSEECINATEESQDWGPHAPWASVLQDCCFSCLLYKSWKQEEC
jgi:hypothetical protein